MLVVHQKLLPRLFLDWCVVLGVVLVRGGMCDDVPDVSIRVDVYICLGGISEVSHLSSCVWHLGLPVIFGSLLHCIWLGKFLCHRQIGIHQNCF